MKWIYHSENLPGNFHKAAEIISEQHPEWDVVAMECTGYNTIVVWREEIKSLHPKTAIISRRDERRQ